MSEILMYTMFLWCLVLTAVVLKTISWIKELQARMIEYTNAQMEVNKQQLRINDRI